MIGIIGGTFDPIHFGHLRPALEITEALELSELRFIPSAKPPHRWQPEASAEQRLAMVKLALKGNAKLKIDDREYHREGASFTVDTLQSIRDEISPSTPLCMILGMDAFQSFTTWKSWQKILSLCHIVVSSRPGYEIDLKVHDYLKDKVIKETEHLRKNKAGKVYFCETTQLDISATNIRKQLHNGSSCDYLTPQVVCDYINEHKLYR